jgi:cytosine/adenosine deaminase-related metal-dependent hydrolase
LNVRNLAGSAAAGDDRLSLRARWVFPVWGPPLENGVVEVTAGRISAVHDRPGPVTADLGNAAIIPGIVNAHTHLELSDVAEPLQPAMPFTAWLKAVMAHRRTRTSQPTLDIQPENDKPDFLAAVAGRRESARFGTTLIGDIAGAQWSPLAVRGNGPRVVAFIELLGRSPERAEAQLEKARMHIGANDGIVRGLSPHAPYSVHPDLLRKLVDLSVKNRAPLAMHLAETRAELELLESATGEFVAFLEELGVWNPAGVLRGIRPLDFLRELARAEVALAIHGNYFADDEFDFLAEHPNLSVVYCPRTHACFGHDEHPWRRLLARRINVALGTDSRASNPDLGLWNELLFLRRLAPDFDPAQLLRMGTWNGAFALGLETEAGSLALGNPADLAVVELADGAGSDAYALLFRPENQIAATMCSGHWLVD